MGALRPVAKEITCFTGTNRGQQIGASFGVSNKYSEAERIKGFAFKSWLCPCTSCVTLAKSLDLSMLPFPQMKDRGVGLDNF